MLHDHTIIDVIIFISLGSLARCTMRELFLDSLFGVIFIQNRIIARVHLCAIDGPSCFGYFRIRSRWAHIIPLLLRHQYLFNISRVLLFDHVIGQLSQRRDAMHAQSCA